MTSQASASFSPASPRYELHSDLAAYCLPASDRDDTRKLAWANSICALFLAVAALNWSEPIFVQRPQRQVALPPPVIVLPPPPSEPAVHDSPGRAALDSEPEPVVELATIEPVLVAAPEEVAFSVPIEGYVALALDARFVPPPPRVIPREPPPVVAPPTFKPIRFGGREFRKQPPPNYPTEFQRNRIGGTVEVLITVDTEGVPTSVTVGRSSGSPALDRHVTEFIKREWRAHPGEGGYYRIAITFAP